MTFRWVLRDTPKSVSGESQAFETQVAAEDWIGDSWRRLLDEGHLAATLVDGDDELYTMKLTPD